MEMDIEIVAYYNDAIRLVSDSTISSSAGARFSWI